MEKMTLEQFKDYVKKNDENKVENSSGIAGAFEGVHKNKDGFAFVCRKCGSMKISIEGDSGMDYGGMTGYSPGENVIKCLECGNAISIWS